MAPDLQKKFRQLEDARIRLMAEMPLWSDAQKRFKPGPEQWSVLETLDHLLVIEQLALGYMRKKSQANDLPRAGLASQIRTLILTITLRLPLKIKAPTAFIEPREDLSFDSISQAWQQVRLDLAAFVDQLPDDIARRAIFKHALAGYLNVEQLFDFLYHHFHHHLKQLERIKADEAFPDA